jgi:PhoH-like ATPase
MNSPDAAAPGLPRTFILDTNVLLYDPTALNNFREHDVVIPITVIEEIDKFKKDLNETGRNARMVSRQLDALRSAGSLSVGVPLAHGGTLRVEMPSEGVDLPYGFGPNSNDNLILATVLSVARRDANRRVSLITRDTNMRIKADALGFQAEDYEHGHIDVDERYSGVVEQVVPASRIVELYGRGSLPLSAEEAAAQGLHPNQFLTLRAEESATQTALARYEPRLGRLRVVGRSKEAVWGLLPRNREQIFALDLLLDDEISLVTLDGMAGTGKTLLAIACGLKLVADEKRFRRLVVSRPIFPLGRDLGFLPGDISAKLNPWMKPIFDNLELLMGGQEGEEQARRKGSHSQGPLYQTLLDQGLVEVEPLTYIRGRSMPRQYMIIDEAQNLTPHELKTVVTRAGEGTKVVLTGDPQQIDNPYVDATSNGLSHVIERMKGSPIAGHVTLRKGERSELAELAAKAL